MQLAVNIAPRNLLDAGLPDRVLAACAEHDVRPDQLELELTETAVLTHPGRSMRVLHRLVDSGVRVWIDDYGTGHASLAYLRRLPIAGIKIDRSLVTTMLVDPVNAALVEHTLVLADRLALDVLAEGVEDAATADALADLGCRHAQGNYLAPAAALPAVAASAALSA